MKIDLYQPPPWVLYGTPLIATSTLTAALRTAGYDVAQYDVNLEIRDDYILNEAVAVAAYTHLASKLSDHHSNDWDQLARSKIVRLLESLPDPIEELRKLRATIDEELACRRFNLSTYQRIIEFQQLLALGYSEIKWYDYVLSVKGGIPSFADIDDESRNPFIRFLRHVVPNRTALRKPDIVGISIAAPEHLLGGLAIARLTRGITPGAFIVLGGDFFRRIQRDPVALRAILSNYADAIILHEGERTLVELCDIAGGGRDVSGLPNVICQGPNGLTFGSVRRPDSLQTLPHADFTGLRLNRYISLPIEINRGCYWAKCTFCRHASKVSQIEEPLRFDYRKRDVDGVLDYIENTVETTGIDIFEFAGLAYSPVELERFSDGVLRRKLRIRWGCRPRIERTLTPLIIDKMIESGVYLFHIAIETFNARLQRLLNKHYDVALAKKIITYIRSVHGHPPLILNVMYDIPTETHAELMETIEYLQAEGLSGEFFRFWMDRSSVLYQKARQYGLEIVEHGDSTNRPTWTHVDPELESARASKMKVIARLRECGVVCGYRNYFDFGSKQRIPESLPAKVIHFMSQDAEIAGGRS